jgi:glycosyltransferase involved in cell wall biosynthesis
MRVLQVNKFLYGGAGAETMMFRTADLLRAHGHEVSFFAMQDPRNAPCAESKYFPRGRYYGAEHGAIRRVRDGAASIYSLEARRALRRLVKNVQPDVAHLHNVYHQLTLSVVDELADTNIPIIMTLHDYKPVCPSYTLYTDNEPCHRCVTGTPIHAVKHRCVKGSRAASALGAMEAVATRVRRTYHRVDAFIAPSRHIAAMMVAGGHPAERIHVIPNFVADEQFAGPGMRELPDQPTFLFVGRLEEVKGVDVLLAATRATGGAISVTIVGDGPLEPAVTRAQSDGVVRYLGRRSWEEISQLMDRANALVVPSLWEENCPMVALEAGARGCPVIAADRGGLKELVTHGYDGLLVRAGDADALAEAMLGLGSDIARCVRLGRKRQVVTATRNTAAVHATALIELYEAVSVAKQGASR